MMRTIYANHYCCKCDDNVDHVKLTYADEIVLICMICQNETVKKPMKKTYTVVTILDDGYQTEKRRKVVAEIRCKSEPDKLGEKSPEVETFMVSYPAYSGEHYTASISKHPNGGFINHIEATAIAIEIKRFSKDKK